MPPDRGVGEFSDFSHEERETLKKLARWSDDELETLRRLARWSDEELETVRLVAKYWAGINAVSRVARGVGRLGQYLIYAYAIYVAFKFGLLDQFLVGKPPK